MKSIRKKKKFNPWTLVYIVLILAMAASLIWTLHNKGLIRFKNEQSEENVSYMTIAYSAGIPKKGTFIKDCIAYKDVKADDSAVFPSDIITPSDDIEGLVLRIDIEPDTPLSMSMVCPFNTDELDNPTTRYMEVDYVTPPVVLKVGDYVDIRFSKTSKTGEVEYKDAIVAAKRLIVAINGQSVTLKMDEDDIIKLTCAGAEKNLANNYSYSSSEKQYAAELTMTIYTNPSQPKATSTYSNPVIEEILRNNPNLLNDPDALYQYLIEQEEIPVSEGE